MSGRADPAAPADDRGATGDHPIDPDEVDPDPAARAGLYSLLARGFRHPDEAFHGAAVDGGLAEELAALVATCDLDLTGPAVDLPVATGSEGDLAEITSDDDFETCCARYNDLFVIGFSAYEDRTDGSLASDGPPVPLYETTYRPEASWGDVNLDLARAYEYFGLGVDESDRDNHDALPLQLEFAAYLARREALGDAGAAAARLDLLDRHLSYVAAGVCERLDEETGTGLYGDLGQLLAALVQAEQADLGERRAAGALAPADGPAEDSPDGTGPGGGGA